MANTPFEQLSEYCDCMEDVKERDVIELINLISTYTCWTQTPCETFLLSERKEVVEIPQCVKDCDVFEFEPFYKPFDKDSFTFYLIEQEGIDETSTEITSYGYSETDGKFRLELPLPTCQCRPRCGCEKKYKLLVTYVAGYELIPECLLPLFCEALQYVIEKNKCVCEDCEPCKENDYSTPSQIDYTNITGQLQEYLVTTLAKQYFSQLGLISLCNKYKGELWGVVV